MYCDEDLYIDMPLSKISTILFVIVEMLQVELIRLPSS